MPGIPREPAFDSTLALLREGYAFIPRRCRAHGTDAFAARLMLRSVVCMSGAEAVQVFYEPGRFTRQGSTPRSVLRLLQDRGSVQTLDGADHRHRKEMFLSLITPESTAELCQAFQRNFQERIPLWSAAQGEICLATEMEDILCAAACEWAGIALRGPEARRRLARSLSAMFHGAGKVGPRNWLATGRRMGTEQWLRGIAAAARRNDDAVPGRALSVMLAHRQRDGSLLGVDVVAVEMLNLLRPIVAIANYIVFAALALHMHPDWRVRLARGDEATRVNFAQEVRRYYPFFPFVGGRVREAFRWHGHEFAVGDWVLLDLYGTNLDPRIWREPDRFDPDRFNDHDITPFDLVPQGGGDVARGHRCPGEPVALQITKAAAVMLASQMTYVVPPQDLTVDLGDIPALPASGMRIRDVRDAATRAPGAGISG